MLKRLLLVLDVVLVVTAGTLGVELHRIWTAAQAAAAPAGPPPGAGERPSAPAPAPAARPPAPSGSASMVIAERNLFSPTRAEVLPEPPKPTQTATAAPQPPARPVEKPRLYGVVIGADGGSRAYLWDPQTRKVFGYKVGDSLADSRVEEIGGDRVVMRRGEDVFEVLLRDPSKPRPAPAPVAPAPPAGVPPAPVPAPRQVPGAPSPQFPQRLFPGSAPGAGRSSPFTPPGGAMTPGQPLVPGQSPFGSPGATTPPRPGTFPFTPGRPSLRMPPGVPAPPQSSREAGS